MLHWLYVAMAVYFAALIVWELFAERRWREQVALALLLVPLLLRILHLK